METERVAKRSTTNYMSTFGLSITVGELAVDVLDVTVTARVEGYNLFTKAVRVTTDCVDQLPADAYAGLLRWIAWLVEAERQHRAALRGERPQSPATEPDWPSPFDLPSLASVRAHRQRAK